MTPQERSDKLAKIYEVINFPYDEYDAVYSPVTIGDFLDWIEKLPDTEYEIEMSRIDKICSLWKYKRTMIDYQSDECIDYIHSLIK